jgi:predicted amidohydrolase YtcJ
VALGAIALDGSADVCAADLVLRNGNIRTVDASRLVVDAVAIEKGRISAVGTDAQSTLWIGPSTTVIDLHGRAVYPGFKDSHAHLLELGLSRLSVDLEGARDFDEVIAHVKRVAATRKAGTWILGRGWHEEKWTHLPGDAVHGFPVHQALSAATPNNPVVLERADGHALLANARAMQLMQINSKTSAPTGGQIIHDSAGEPTGIFVDDAMDLIKVPPPSVETKRKAWDLAFRQALRSGIIAVDEPGLSLADITLLKQLGSEGRVPIRIYAMLGGWSVLQHFDRPEIGLDHGFLTIRAVKLYADGALGSRGAAMLAPYNDDPRNTGLLVTPVDELRKSTSYAFDHGFQVATHAIGDRANRLILDLYQEAQSKDPTRTDLRWRIEHAQILSAQDIPRFEKLGIIASMQTVHATSDRPWAPARIGMERIKEGAYAWRKLLATGAHIANGTDAPVESIDPIRNFYAAVTREDEKGNPPGGFDPEERMTRDEALRSYTIEGAYATFTEKESGSIEVGKNADLVVLSEDIMTVPDHDVLKAKVLMTIVGGEILYDASHSRSGVGGAHVNLRLHWDARISNGTQ